MFFPTTDHPDSRSIPLSEVLFAIEGFVGRVLVSPNAAQDSGMVRNGDESCRAFTFYFLIWRDGFHGLGSVREKQRQISTAAGEFSPLGSRPDHRVGGLSHNQLHQRGERGEGCEGCVPCMSCIELALAEHLDSFARNTKIGPYQNKYQTESNSR